MKANRTTIRETRTDHWLRIILYALLAVVLAAYVYPLYFLVIASISDPNAVYNGEVLFLPAQITFEDGIRQRQIAVLELKKSFTCRLHLIPLSPESVSVVTGKQ